MSAAAWDPRWNLRAPASSSSAAPGAPTSSYASWKRRVQALLEAESVWEVVSEGVVFDEAWPLPKQLEFIQKDKLGMHLILSTVHDSVVALLQDGGAGECNRSWLMLKRLETVFAAHRMKSVRLARREFLDLNFVNFVKTHYGGNGANASATGGAVDEENDAMQRFIERVQEKGDTLFRLRGQQPALLLLDDASASSYCEDEKMYQLLDALPVSWGNFIAQECASQGDLTWASVQRKVLQEHSKRRAERRKRLLQQGGTSSSHAGATVAATATASTASSVASVVSSRSNSRSKAGGANSSNNSAEQQDQDDQGENNAGGGYPAPAHPRLGSANAFSSPVLAAKEESPASDSSQQQQNQNQNQRLDDQYDLRSPVDEEVMVYDFVGHQPPDSYPQQQQQSPIPPYQSQQPQDQYYDHSARPKYGNRNNSSSSSSLNNPRNRRDRDNNNGSGGGQQRTPYNRPPNQNANANKICFYCSMPGHTAHHCPLKRMHAEERKKNNNSHQ